MGFAYDMPLSQEDLKEAATVRSQAAIPELLGDCISPWSRQPCPCTALCNQRAIRGALLVCYQAMFQRFCDMLQALRAEVVATRADIMFAYMQEIGAAVTFREIIVALGWQPRVSSSAEYHAWRSALHSLQHNGRISIAGERVVLQNQKQITVALWIVGDGGRPRPAPRPCGRGEKHITHVLAVLTEAGRPLTVRELKPLLGLPYGSTVSNVLSRLHAKGRIARRLRQITPGDAVYEYWTPEGGNP